MRRALAAILAVAAGALVVLGVRAAARRPAPPIRVGVLHSFRGTMAASETAVAHATQLAIEEINAKGGVLGRRIEPVVADGASDPAVFAREAQRLVGQEGVAAIFGCWTSASRKAVKPVVERLNGLLFYPVQSEGLEESPRIVYTGASPNQQIIPAASWALDRLGRRFFLVGSDYVFPRTANAIVKDVLAARGGEVAGEEYAPLGSSDFGAIAARIAAARPDVVLNTVNGDGNAALFAALRAAGVTPDAIPVMSVSVAENEVKRISGARAAGDYATWSYFQSLATRENRRFVSAYRARWGADQVTDDPAEAGWFGVWLWAQAVRDAGTPDPGAVLAALPNQSFEAPEGTVTIDPATRHTWKAVYVGRVRADGEFDVVWSSGKPVRPAPWPVFRTRAQWEDFLSALSKGWGGGWARPA